MSPTVVGSIHSESVSMYNVCWPHPPPSNPELFTALSDNHRQSFPHTQHDSAYTLFNVAKEGGPKEQTGQNVMDKENVSNLYLLLVIRHNNNNNNKCRSPIGSNPAATIIFLFYWFRLLV